MFLHLFAFVYDVFAFSQGNAQKMQKHRKKNANTKQQNAKAKARTFLIAFVLLFNCMFFVLFPIFVPFCAFVLHFLCGFCIFLVDKCGVFAICLLFCIPRHPLVTCFLAFSVHFFRDWFCIIFCIVYAFFMFCCVIRTSFSIHHNSKVSKAKVLNRPLLVTKRCKAQVCRPTAT